MADKLTILMALRKRIPEFECIPGCTQCCGHTAWSEFEWKLIPQEDRLKFDFFSLKCSYLKDGACSIYAQRSLICRMVGVCEGMPCPRGVRPQAQLDKETTTAIGKEYVKNYFKGESQWRHGPETSKG